MTESHQEFSALLSSALDNELTSSELNSLLHDLGTHDEKLETWSRYNLIGQVIRQGADIQSDCSLWRRVRDQLESEPTILAPKPFRTKVSPTNSQRFVGFALAASLLAITVTVGKSFLENSPRVFSNEIVSVDQNLDHQTSAAVDSRFDDYLLVHNESAQLAGAGSLVPYARLANLNSPVK